RQFESSQSFPGLIFGTAEQQKSSDAGLGADGQGHCQGNRKMAGACRGPILDCAQIRVIFGTPLGDFAGHARKSNHRPIGVPMRRPIRELFQPVGLRGITKNEQTTAGADQVARRSHESWPEFGWSSRKAAKTSQLIESLAEDGAILTFVR